MNSLILIGAIALGSLNPNSISTGTVTSQHSITFKNGGYYTEHKLTNIGDDVVVIGDAMIVDGKITYLK